MVFKLCVLLLLAFQYKAVAQKIIVSDPLTSSALIEGEIRKIGVGGQFTEKGWQATAQGDYCTLILPINI